MKKKRKRRGGSRKVRPTEQKGGRFSPQKEGQEKEGAAGFGISRRKCESGKGVTARNCKGLTSRLKKESGKIAQVCDSPGKKGDAAGERKRRAGDRSAKGEGGCGFTLKGARTLQMDRDQENLLFETTGPRTKLGEVRHWESTSVSGVPTEGKSKCWL